MAIPKLPVEKCRRANALASQKGVDTTPLRFVASPEAGTDFIELRNQGRMPETPNAALGAINAMLPEGAGDLAPDDVYVHYLEAANGNFIPDRFMYLGKSTLQNISVDAARGVAFMNSHRTGGMSAAAELPYGKTFAGQFQNGLDEAGNKKERAIVGAYMLAGTMPNGNQGPSTDDLHRLIKGGIIADVSVGLYGGERICNVCNKDLFGYDPETYQSLCPHVPGTHYEMSKEEITAEIDRDGTNVEGYATFTLNDSHFSEVSAVYDGAVPGAGVKKVLSLAYGEGADSAALEPMLKEAMQAYGHLLPEKLTKRIKPGGKVMSLKDKLMEFLNGVEEEPPTFAQLPDATGTEARTREAQLQAEAEKMREQLAQMQKDAATARATVTVQTLAGNYLQNGSDGELGDREEFTAMALPLFTKLHAGQAVTPEEVTALLSVPTGGSITGAAVLSFAPPATAHAYSKPEPKDPNGVDQTARRDALQNTDSGKKALQEGRITIPDERQAATG